MNRRVVRDMLKVGGVELIEAADAFAGFRLLEQFSFDVILMDLRMPGMDGIEAIQHIRARGDDKATVPIIVITADTAHDLRGRCLASGADELLLKPVAMQALFETIGRVATSRELDDELLV